MTKPFIHPNTPSKLRAAFRAAKNLRGEGYKYHILAEKIGVNVGQLHNLIRKGIEPTDATEKGQAARVAMFLPRKKRHKQEGAKKERKEIPPHLYWWTHVLPSDLRNAIIRDVWIHYNSYTGEPKD